MLKNVFSIIGLFAAFGVMANPATLDFNSLATSPGGGVDHGNVIVEDGYRITDSDGLRFNAFEDGWQGNRGGSNGTTTIGMWWPGAGAQQQFFTLDAIDSSPFDLTSIDLGEVVRPGDFAFAMVASRYTFVGNYAAGGTVSRVFSIDMLADGMGGISDFETVVFDSAWSSLLSVEMFAYAPANYYGTYVYFDNIAVESHPDQSVPEPISAVLVGSGLLGLSLVSLRRPSLSASAFRCGPRESQG